MRERELRIRNKHHRPQLPFAVLALKEKMTTCCLDHHSHSHLSQTNKTLFDICQSQKSLGKFRLLKLEDFHFIKGSAGKCLQSRGIYRLIFPSGAGNQPECFRTIHKVIFKTSLRGHYNTPSMRITASTGSKMLKNATFYWASFLSCYYPLHNTV